MAQRERIQLACICIVFLITTGVTLGHSSFWRDELFTVEAVQQSPWQMVAQRAAVGHPPLFFFVEAFLSRILGVSEASLRVFPWLCGLASVVALYFCLHPVGNHALTLTACVGCAFSPLFLWLTQLARSYTFLLLLHLILLSILIRMCQRTNKDSRISWRVYACMAIVSLGAALTHTSAFLTIPVLSLALLLTRPGLWRLCLAMVVGLLPMAIFALAFPQLTDAARHVQWAPPASAISAMTFPLTIMHGPFAIVYSDWLRIASSAFVALIVLRRLLGNDWLSLLAWNVWLTWLSAICLTLFGINTLEIERYYVLAATCVWILVAHALVVICERYRLQVLGASVGCVLVGQGVFNYFAYPIVPCWREMAQAIRLHRTQSEVVLLDGRSNRFEFAFYYHDEPFQVVTNESQGEAMMNEAKNGAWLCGSNQAQLLADLDRCMTDRWPKRDVYRWRNGVLIHRY